MMAGSFLVILRVVGTCLVFAYFVFWALKSRYRHSVAVTCLWMLGLIIITTVIVATFLTPLGKFYRYNILGIILWLVIAVVFLNRMIRVSILEVWFLVLVLMNLYVNIVAIGKITVSEMSGGCSDQVLSTWVTFVVVVLYSPLLYFLFLKLYRQVMELNINTNFWKIIWMIPALTYMIFYVKILEDYWRSTAPTNRYDVVFGILWSITTYILFCISLQMLIQGYKGISTREEIKLVTTQLHMQETQYKNLLDNIEHTSRLRHDWRHHLLTINSLVENGDMEKLHTYLKDLMPEYMPEIDTAICQNHVVSAILQHYVTLAKEKGITLDYRVDVPESLGVRDTDLCIIFGNLIENAMDACLSLDPDEASLWVTGEIQGNQLMILVRNTYSNPVVLEDGVYHSSKHEGVGIGISSVKKVIESYSGEMKVGFDKNFFHVFLILNQKTV